MARSPTPSSNRRFQARTSESNPATTPSSASYRMCSGIPDEESEPELAPDRSTATRRRQLEWLTNFVLVVVSLFGISVGSGLLVFYKIQLLSFISTEFYIVPLVLLGGGIFTLMVSVVGLIATSRKSPCLLILYAFFLLLAFIVLVAGISCSVRIIFIVFHGIDHYSRLALPLIRNYGKNNFATSTWDLLHDNYRCCGAETTFDLGYMVWEKNDLLQRHLAVPDSCCLEPESGCGFNVFKDHNLEHMADYVKRIHVHGCIQAMDNVLSRHVVPILTVFSISGSILAMIELLGVVLACCLAQALRMENKFKKRQHVIQMRRSQDRISIGKVIPYNDTHM